MGATGRWLNAGVLVALLVATLVGVPMIAPAAYADEGMSRTVSAGYVTDVADANRFQLILVVRFAGDDTGEGETGLNEVRSFDGRTEWEALADRLNGFSDSTFLAPTLYSYVKDVSGGLCRLQSLCPQADAAGRVRYLTLPRERDAYAYAVQVVEAALEAFNDAYPSFDGKLLDGNGDGLADNVLVIPEVGKNAPTLGSPLWPHAATFTGSAGIGSGGKAVKVGSYTMVDSSRARLGSGTIIHETLHTFGAKDLYRSAGDIAREGNRPVGVWDIMAEHGGSKLMRPLAITRQDCGWGEIAEVPAGTVQLHAPGKGGLQAVKFKTDAHATEYFVAEFRRANTDIANLAALDTSSEGSPMTIGGSGLVVYRVNPAMKAEGNGNKGEKDYVYIFRSGETGGPRGDGAGDVRHAQLTATERPVLGSSDLGAGLLDGAITYSDGQNSGAVIRVTAQSEESITFTLELPDADELGLWKAAADAAGATVPLGADFVETSLFKAADGSVYQLCERMAGGASVCRYDGSSWKNLGTLAIGFSGFGAVVYDGALYVAGARYRDDAVELWRYDGRQWVSVASVSASANRVALGVAGGRLFLFADGGGSAARLFVLKGKALEAVGDPLTGMRVAGACLFDTDGAPAVMLGDYEDKTTKLLSWTGGHWISRNVHADFAHEVSGFQDARFSLALTTTQDGTVRLVDLASQDALSIRELSDMPKAFSAKLAMEGATPYVGVVEQGTQIARVYRSRSVGDGRWEQVGANVIAPSTAFDVETLGGAVLVSSIAGRSDPVALLRFGEVGSLVAPSVPGVGGPTASTAPDATARPGTPSKPSSSGSDASSSGSAKPAGSPASAASPSKTSSSSSKSAAKPKPPSTAFSKVKSKKRALVLSWKKRAKRVTGYQIRCSTSKKFSKKATRTIWVKSAKKSSVTVKKLKAKKTYYVQIRTYKKTAGKTYYSSWSKTRKVKTR